MTVRAPTMGRPMHFRQKSAVATIAALVGAYGSYAAGIAIQLPNAHIGDVAYKPSMVAATVLLVIVMVSTQTVLAALAPAGAGSLIDRDREFSHRADRIGGYVLSTGVFVALALTLLENDDVYIANALLLTWVIAEITAKASLLRLSR